MKNARKKGSVNVRRWLPYAAAGAAFTGMAVSEADASYTYLYSGPVNESLTGGGPLVPGGAAADIFSLQSNSHRANHPEYSTLMVLHHQRNTAATKGKDYLGVSSWNQNIAGIKANGHSYVSMLAAGGKVAAQNFGIGPLGYGKQGLLMASKSNGGNFQWGGPAGTIGYIAFELDGNGWSNPNPYLPWSPALDYAWVKIENLGSPLDGIEILSYAYSNDPTFDIGQIGPPMPEPSSLALLAFGAMGLLTCRRRQARKANAKAAAAVV